MRTSKRHNQADCNGKLVRVYGRPDGARALVPLGYECDVCGYFLRDGGAMKSVSDLSLAIESVSREVTNLVADRQIYDRFAGIVRGNDKLLAAAQHGNLFLQGVRRWWAGSAALVLRRHADGGSGPSLRAIVEALADESGDIGLPAQSRNAFAEDLIQLETISARFRPYLNNIIYGPAGGSSNQSLTFNDLTEAIDVLKRISTRAYAAIKNISLVSEPVILQHWTNIFEYAWIDDRGPVAYVLGEEGVPYDAQPMTEQQARENARLDLKIDACDDGSRKVIVSNAGKRAALDVRVFLPYAGTVIDVDEIAVKKSKGAAVSETVVPVVAGQAVLEFSDVNDRAYRQYAYVDLDNRRVRNLSPVAFRVNGRIVARGPVNVA